MENTFTLCFYFHYLHQSLYRTADFPLESAFSSFFLFGNWWHHTYSDFQWKCVLNVRQKPLVDGWNVKFESVFDCCGFWLEFWENTEFLSLFFKRIIYFWRLSDITQRKIFNGIFNQKSQIEYQKIHKKFQSLIFLPKNIRKLYKTRKVCKSINFHIGTVSTSLPQLKN